MNIVYVFLLVGFTGLLFGFFACLAVLLPELRQTRRRLRAARARIEALESAEKPQPSRGDSNFRLWPEVTTHGLREVARRTIANP